MMYLLHTNSSNRPPPLSCTSATMEGLINCRYGQTKAIAGLVQKTEEYRNFIWSLLELIEPFIVTPQLRSPSPSVPSLPHSTYLVHYSNPVLPQHAHKCTNTPHNLSQGVFSLEALDVAREGGGGGGHLSLQPLTRHLVVVPQVCLQAHVQTDMHVGSNGA